MLRTIIHSEKYIYLSNTDLWNSITPIFYQRMPGPGVVKDYSQTFSDMKHFYGLASGFKTVNHVLGYLINCIGGYHVTWKIQHNVLHHSFTNIHEHDEDLNQNVMRFSPNQER